MNPNIEIGTEAMKITPPAAVVGAEIMGFSTPSVIASLTVLYLVLSIGLLIPKYWMQLQEWRDRKAAAKKAERERDGH